MNIPLSKFFLFTLFVFTAIFPLPSVAEVPAKMIAYNCFTCHGEISNNLNFSQPLDENEIAQALLAFKYDKKIATIMNRISKGYTDSELKSVAAYLCQFQ